MTYDYDFIPVGYYDEIFHRKKGIQSSWHYLKFLGVKQTIAPKTKTLLDVGCGPGTFLGNFIDSHIDAVGFDIAKPQIDYANQTYKKKHLRFQVGEKKLPFEKEAFDMITCVELIEHLDKGQIEALLKECFRVLKPKGKLVLTTPNYKSLWVLLEKIVNRLAPVSYEDQHISRFDKKSLKVFLEESGFEANVRSYMGLAPFLACASTRCANTFSKIERWTENLYGCLLIAECEKT